MDLSERKWSWRDKVGFVICSVIFVPTVAFVLLMLLCIAEVAWYGHPSRLIRATFNARLHYLELEESRELYHAVVGLQESYDEALSNNDAFKPELWELLKDQDSWLQPVESIKSRLGRNSDTTDEGRGEYWESEAPEFVAAYERYKALLDVVNAELDNARDSEAYKEYDKKYEYRKPEYWLTAKAKDSILDDHREKHRFAVRDLAGQIPFRTAGTLDVWQATLRDPNEENFNPMQQEPYHETPFLQAWVKRYGLPEPIAGFLLALSAVFLLYFFIVTGLSFVEQRLIGTYLLQWLQVTIISLLLAIYIDAPRKALLWLLRRLDSSDGEKLEGGRTSSGANISSYDIVFLLSRK